MHTKHCLRPDREAVRLYLEAPATSTWRTFARNYRALLAARFRQDPAPFAALAAQATAGDVWLGCSCPTATNPDVRRCHTWLALEFMQARFPSLEVVFPAVPR